MEHFPQCLLFRFITLPNYFKSCTSEQSRCVFVFFVFSSPPLNEWFHKHLGEEETCHNRLLSAELCLSARGGAKNRLRYCRDVQGKNIKSFFFFFLSSLYFKSVRKNLFVYCCIIFK